jgi:hypothetical protein
LLTEQDMRLFSDAPKNLQENNAKFALDFTRGKEFHKAVVGVYEAQKEKGAFLLVVKKEKDEWKKMYFEKLKGEANFSMLTPRGEDALWCSCMACDGCSRLKWNGKAYSLESLASEYD